ncbi:MAG: hypothetical protein ACPG4T_05550, partial [Nannocystaceae bacterium]
MSNQDPLQATQLSTVTVKGDIAHSDRYDRARHETLMAICNATNSDPAKLLEAIGCNASSRLRDLEEYCRRLEAKCDALEHKGGGGCGGKCSTIDKRCDGLWKFCVESMCPGRIPYSRFTMDDKSQESQIILNQIVKVADANFVDQYPVAPGQGVKLTHIQRPGFIPKKINIDLHLANAGNNYPDIEIEFYLVGGSNPRKIGVTYEGNNFLNKDGSQIFQAWPHYKGR